MNLMIVEWSIFVWGFWSFSRCDMSRILCLFFVLWHHTYINEYLYPVDWCWNWFAIGACNTVCWPDLYFMNKVKNWQICFIFIMCLLMLWMQWNNVKMGYIKSYFYHINKQITFLIKRWKMAKASALIA